MADKASNDQNKSLTQSKIEKLKNGNLEITITIPQEVVSLEYQKKLDQLAKETRVKGFRPGKAPSKLAEKAIGKEKIYQEMIKDLFTQVYLEAVKTHKITPIVNPKITVISAQENQDWQIKALTAELPEFQLGNYQQEIKKVLAPEKIWVPGKGKTGEDKKEDTENKKLQLIFETLLKTINITLPQILIEEEITRLLSQLIDQTARLGLTVEQYLNSIGKTSQQLRSEYQKQAEDSLKLELILAAISNQEKIQVEDQEIDKLIQVVGDEKTKESLQNPSQKAYLRQILRKRKIIDSLFKL